MSQKTLGTATDELLQTLAEWRFEDLPREVVRRTQELFLDWIGSAVAGRNARPTQIFGRWAREMGPASGPSEVLPTAGHSTPYFAALINAASSHVVEQDDVHNGSVFHPAATVFPAVLAAAQAKGASGRDFILAAVVGYEMGVRVGRFLGPSHYKIFHTTGTAGTLAAAAGVSKLLGADAEGMRQSLGSAGTQAAGLWEFLRDGADSKQLHAAKAAADGLLAAYAAGWGLTGARQILEGEQGMGKALSQDADPSVLTEGLGAQWAVMQTSLKYYASCRHTHPTLDALLGVLKTHRLQDKDIARIRAHVHQAALDVLGPAADAVTPHQAKFSMPFVVALLVCRGHVAVDDFNDLSLHDPAIRELMSRVEMVYDDEVQSRYPATWTGRVTVELTDGPTLRGKTDAPKGDPENFLTRGEIEGKVGRLIRFAGIDDSQVLTRLFQRVDQLDTTGRIGDFMADGGI